MTANTVMAEQPDALDLEDELLDFTADLLTLKANQSFIASLLAQPRGQWVNVATIVQDTIQVCQTLTALEASSGGRLQVTWLSHPETNDDYCLILFFMESLDWDSLAVYHRKFANS
jgi:hypothetical protein